MGESWCYACTNGESCSYHGKKKGANGFGTNFLLGLMVAYILSMCVAAGYYYGHRQGYDQALLDVQNYLEAMEAEPVEPSVVV